MYKINRGLNEWSLNLSEFKNIFIKKCTQWNINPYNVKFYSQQDEYKYIIQYLLHL